MKGEERFVRVAARVVMSDADVRDARDAAADGIDWEGVMRICVMHGVEGIVFYSMRRYGLLEGVPGWFEERMRERYYENAVRNMAAEKAVALLSERIGRKVVFVKGADLFLSMYPSTGMRSMGDVDILVEREFAEEVWKGLLESGFAAESGDEIEYRSDVHKDVCSHLPQLKTDAFTVEVHWNLFGVGLLYPITKIAFEKAVRVRDNVYVLSNEMKLVHLCNHFRRHLYTGASLRHLCDINELVRLYGKEIDRAEVDRTVKGTELESDLRIGLTYARFYLGTETEERYFDERLVNEGDSGLERLFVSGKGSKGTVFLYKMRSITGVWNKVRYVYRIAVPPRRWLAANYGSGGVRGYWRYLRAVIK